MMHRSFVDYLRAACSAALTLAAQRAGAEHFVAFLPGGTTATQATCPQIALKGAPGHFDGSGPSRLPFGAQNVLAPPLNASKGQGNKINGPRTGGGPSGGSIAGGNVIRGALASRAAAQRALAGRAGARKAPDVVGRAIRRLK